MGYVLLDHSLGGIGPRGEKGIKEEWDTISCKHCQQVMRIIIHGPARKVLESADRCDKCKAAICKKCAVAMDATKFCPGPLRWAIEKWEDRRQGLESFDFFFKMMGRAP